MHNQIEKKIDQILIDTRTKKEKKREKKKLWDESSAKVMFHSVVLQAPFWCGEADACVWGVDGGGVRGASPLHVPPRGHVHAEDGEGAPVEGLHTHTEGDDVRGEGEGKGKMH